MTPPTKTRLGVAALALAALLALARPAHAWWLSADSTGGSGSSSTTTSGPLPAPATQAGPFYASAQFDMDDVRGFFKFSQVAPSAPTRVHYDLTGLKGNNKLYHVHVRPVPPFERDQVRGNASALARLCGDPATGGHLNPHHISQKLPPKSAPLDKYETGDLSGKHGPLARTAEAQLDRYVGSFQDDRLPMSGPHSLVGRSIVIHKNDGARWVCATIEPEAAPTSSY